MTKEYIDYEGLRAFHNKNKTTYVTKEDGKGLSTNDYTTAEKNKLSTCVTEEELINKGYQASGDVSAIASKIINDTMAQVETRITGVYRFKGSVATYDALPTTGLEVGDAYNVAGDVPGYGTGANFAWTGTNWDAFPGVFNVDPITTAEIIAITDPTTPSGDDESGEES